MSCYQLLAIVCLPRKILIQKKKKVKRVTAIACVSGENKSRKWANIGKLALLYQKQGIAAVTCVYIKTHSYMHFM